MLKNSDMYPLFVRLALALLYKSCIHLIIESLKSGSSVLFAFSITSEINRKFSPIYLRLMNHVCSSLIILVITVLTLFA